MTSPRKPTPADLERMNQAVALVSAYQLGEDEGKYHTFARLSQEACEDDPVESLRACAQFAWMLLESLETTGVTKEQVLEWYGVKFACRAEELRE